MTISKSVNYHAIFYIFITISILINPVRVYSDQLFYVVEKNDHILLVLRTFNQNLYLGEDGAVGHIVQKNSFLQKRKKTDLIRPKDKIYFDDVSSKKIKLSVPYQFTSISEDGRVQFICTEKNLDNWIRFKKEKNMDTQPLDNKYRTLAHRCQVQLSKTISIRSPASAEVDVKDNLRNGFSSFEVGAEFIYSSLETKNKLTQASAKLVSLLDQGIYLKWNQHWNQFLVSHLKVNSQTITITEANSVTIQDRKQQKGGIEMGVSLNQNQSQVDFNLGYQDRILQRYTSPLVVRLEVVPAPYAEANFKHTLTNGRPLMVGLFAGAGAVFPNVAGVYDDQGSFYYQGGFFVGHQELNSGLVASFQYKTNSFNSNEYLKNRLNEIKLDISYRWLWGL